MSAYECGGLLIAYLREGRVKLASDLVARYASDPNMKLWLNSPDNLLWFIAADSPANSLQYVVSLGAKDFARSLLRALVGGNAEGARYLVDRLEPNQALALLVPAQIQVASDSMHLKFELMERVVSRGATNLNSCLILAATSGYPKITKKLVRLGANNISEAISLVQAANIREGGEEVLDYLRSVSQVGA